MLARKPRMLVAIALANKMARSIWAMLTNGADYRVLWLRRPDRRSDWAVKGRWACEESGER